MSSTPANQSRSSGFTLVELLVIAPLAIIIIAGLIYVMISLVGDALISQQRNVATYEAQSGLGQVEQDVRLSAKIKYTTGTLPSPQGADHATYPFTSNGSLTGDSTGVLLDADTGLILTAYATTTNPVLTTRSIIYTNQPAGSCPTPYTSNDPLSYTIIYHVRADPSNNNAPALWRRTVIPSATLCGGATVWQKNSCFPTATCTTEDRLVVSDVSSVSVTYYVETPSPSYSSTAKTSLVATDNPTSVKMVINTSKNVAGSSITATSSIYASRLNE